MEGTDTMKIAVAGAGAMGSRVGLYLTQAGQDVVLLDDWQTHIDAVTAHGLKVHTLGETEYHPVSIRSFKDYSMPVDLVIVLTKAMAAEEKIKQLMAQGVITAETNVMSMMNGLGHGDLLRKYIADDKILLAVTMWSAGFNGPGEVTLEGTGNIEFGRMDGTVDDFVKELNAIFNEAQLNGRISEDVVTSIWNKALVNCCFNTYCAVTDKRIGEFGAYPHADDMLVPLMKEIIAVGERKGARLDFDATLNKFHAMYSPEVVGLHYPSMHQDIQNGRKTEVDFLTGRVAKYGREFGIPTPYCDILTHLVHQIEK